VVEMALGFGHMVTATATQCYIYSVSNWNTPHILDLRAPVSLILLR
jgi:intraflagellar transport protein 80